MSKIWCGARRLAWCGRNNGGATRAIRHRRPGALLCVARFDGILGTREAVDAALVHSSSLDRLVRRRRSGRAGEAGGTGAGTGEGGSAGARGREIDRATEMRDQAGDDRRRAARVRRAHSPVMALDLERQTTVLFANVLGDADATACRDHLRKAAEACGARVVDRAADKLMALLAAPDAAAEAAAAMHTAMEGFAQGKAKLALGVGFHHGPVIQKENEVFGDTVNLAARLFGHAASGPIHP